MSLQVLVTFPGQMNLEVFSEHVQTLKGMGCQVHLETLANVTKKQIGYVTATESLKKRVGREFNEVFSEKENPLMSEELTPQELSLLDQGLKAIFDKKETPLLDSMGILKPKLNVSHEIRVYFQENPGQNANQAAANLANKLESHFSNINDAFRRIKSLINVLCSRNSPQYALDRRGGRGMNAQIYPL